MLILYKLGLRQFEVSLFFFNAKTELQIATNNFEAKFDHTQHAQLLWM